VTGGTCRHGDAEIELERFQIVNKTTQKRYQNDATYLQEKEMQKDDE